MTYGVLSDLHCHSWSSYSSLLPSGVNSRLQLILDELVRAGAAIRSAGGRTMVIAGDIFHVRGSIDPEVLNPTQTAVQKVLDLGIDIFAIPGNHDLKSKDTSELSSAIQTLGQTASESGNAFHVINEPRLVTAENGEQFAFVPWCSSNKELLDNLRGLARACGEPDVTDAFIHAGISNVLPGLPDDHGIDPAELAGFGFRNVFAGHFHNHKDLGRGVYSIGATTHQTWGDVGTKAGFLLVESDGKVKFRDTHAPKFVDVSGLSEADIRLLADGNYVRFRGDPMAPSELEELRRFFVDNGARGTSIQAPKKAVNARGASQPTKAQTLDQSVSSFVEKNKNIPEHIDRKQVQAKCNDVLGRARAVYEEA